MITTKLNTKSFMRTMNNILQYSEAFTEELKRNEDKKK